MKEQSLEITELSIKMRENLVSETVSLLNELGERIFILFKVIPPSGSIDKLVIEGNLNNHINEDGMIVLNVCSSACPDLTIKEGFIYGTMRSGGQVCGFCIPVGCILSIWCDNGHVFQTSIMLAQALLENKEEFVEEPKNEDNFKDSNVVSLFGNKTTH